MSLRYKILLPTIGLIVLIVLATVFLSYQKTAQALRESLFDNMERQASTLVASTVAFSSDFINMASQTADRPDVRDILDGDYLNPEKVEESNRLLAGLKDFYTDCDRMSVVDFMGSIVASSDPSNIGYDISDTEFFKQVSQNGRVYRAPAGKSDISGEVTMVAAAPIYSGGNVTGMLVCVITLEGYYKRYVAPVSIGHSGYAYVLNSRAEVLAHRDTSVLFRSDLPQAAMHERMVSTKTGVEDYIDEHGKRIIAYYTSDAPTRTTTVIQAEYDDVYAALDAIRNRSLILAALAILIGVAVMLCIVTPVTNALEQGVRFATDIAAGRLDGSLTIRRGDELGKLADALRAIPDSLREVLHEYRTLQERIRTGELDAKGDPTKFQGEFASLVNETNAILERFHVVLDSVPSPVIMVGSTLRSTYANRTAKTELHSACSGQSCEQIFLGKDVEGDNCGLKRAVVEKQPVQTEMSTLIDGCERDYLHTAIPMFGPGGRLDSVLLLSTDLTSVTRAQRTVMELVQQAGSVAEDTSSAAEELATRIEQVRSGTVTQRERADSTAAAMEQMNATMTEVARNTSEASQQADTTRQRAENGNELVSMVLASISEVNTVAQDLRRSMQQLGAQADGIGGVMTVIADIADQTNLLALNAAIEAARAGESGRGFAVVADEVRKLAEKTMQATNEVGRNIGGIQSAASENITKVERVSQNAEQATGLAADSGRTLRDIVTLAQNSSSLITGIAAAVEEQSTTLDEITRAMEAINQVANETSQGMDFSAEAVTALARKAKDLQLLLENVS